MHTALFAALAVAHLALLARLLRQGPGPGPLGRATLALPLVGLVYDNLALAVGPTLGAGPLLRALSAPRFALHALLTPLWVVGAGELARQGGGEQAPRRRLVLGLVAAALVAVELPHLAALELTPAAFGDSLRYTHAAPSGPPVGALGTLAVVLALAPAIGWRVAAGGAALLVLAALPAARVGPGPGNVGELLLGAALVHAAGRGGRPGAPAAVGSAPP